VLREDVGLQFSTVRSVDAFAEIVACVVMNLVEEVQTPETAPGFNDPPCPFKAGNVTIGVLNNYKLN
jgi:hypothetical protein